jgi:UDP-N-acetylglucosamine diphosphorylase/glucosamine-1-phosphate N-acetyltransferase
MASTVCVFEDEQNEFFLPIAYTRPVYDLLCGAKTLYQKIAGAYTACEIRHLCRPHLIRIATNGDRLSLVGSRDGRVAEQVLFVNGRILATDALSDLISPEGKDCLFVAGDELAAARLSGPRLGIGTKWIAEQDTASILSALAREVHIERIELPMVHFPWDLIHANGSEIRADFAQIHAGELGEVHSAATVYAPQNVYVAQHAEVMAGAVIDARDGPVIIETGARIEPGSYIQGPAYIGPYSRVVTARIREDTSIGPYCRIGGEVECTIFHGYSNKYHDGFIGHSYFGEWVNLGALTTTSDLKNTYGTVRVDVKGRAMDTGLTKLGSIVGDHVKLGIGVLLNSGSTIGTGCNLFGGGMLPKVVPCFIWGGNGEFQEYDFERMLETAQIAMSRRDVEQTEAHNEVLRFVFEMTAPLRREGRI